MRLFHAAVWPGLLITILCAALSLNAVYKISGYRYPYQQSKISPLPEYAIMDMSGLLFGARRLASDIAWVQLLQYYGAAEEECEDENCGETHTDGHKVHYRYAQKQSVSDYPKLLSYCNRIIQLDPFFSYVYLYGAGALAWNENRPEEAISLLETGIRNMEAYSAKITNDVHQPYWQFNLYMAAIIYRKEGKFEQMFSNLEFAVSQPSCPNMMKAILANIYEQNKNYKSALKLWLAIYDTNDPSYHSHAEKKIQSMRGNI